MSHLYFCVGAMPSFLQKNGGTAPMVPPPVLVARIDKSTGHRIIAVAGGRKVCMRENFSKTMPTLN